MQLPVSQFPGMRAPSTDFLAVQTQLRHQPDYVDIDLTNARSHAAGTALMLPIAGNSIYADDKGTTGIATLHFQDSGALRPTPISVQSGFIARVPFTFVVVENDAQPGKILRLIYGVDVDFVPGSKSTLSISGSVASVPVQSVDARYPGGVISVTVLGTQLGANASVRERRYYNAGPATVYIVATHVVGVSNVIAADHAMCAVPPGATYIEDSAAAADWSLITASGTASVAITEIY